MFILLGAPSLKELCITVMSKFANIPFCDRAHLHPVNREFKQMLSKIYKSNFFAWKMFQCVSSVPIFSAFGQTNWSGQYMNTKLFHRPQIIFFAESYSDFQTQWKIVRISPTETASMIFFRIFWIFLVFFFLFYYSWPEQMSLGAKSLLSLIYNLQISLVSTSALHVATFSYSVWVYPTNILKNLFYSKTP